MRHCAIIFFLILFGVSCHAQGNPPCFNTPFFATGGNWFIPMVSVTQEHCFLDQCQPIVAVNALDFDFVGFKKIRVVAPQSHVSAVFTTYTCDSVLSVQCDGIIGDTAVFELDYSPPCLVFFLSDAQDTIFVMPGPDSSIVQPQPYACSLTAVDNPREDSGPPQYLDYFTGRVVTANPLPPGVYVCRWPDDPFRAREKRIVFY